MDWISRCSALLVLLLCSLSLLLLSSPIKDLPVHGQRQSVNLKAHQWRCDGCFKADFPVVINQPQVCSTRETETIDIVFFIPSSLDGAERRNAIRKTWASVSNNNTSNFRHVFVLGITRDRLRMRLIEEESFRFRDVVVIEFIDSYNNLTLKTMASLRWLTLHCGYARFFFKVDDDVWLNTRTLLATFNSHTQSLLNSVGGSCSMSHNVIRDPRAKWYASYASYPDDEYPNYCSGTGYGSSLAVARKLVAASTDVPFFHMEDIYVGLSLRHLGLSVLHLPGFRVEPTWDPCDGKSDAVVTLHDVSPRRMLAMWRARCGSDRSRFLRRQNLLLDVLFLLQ